MPHLRSASLTALGAALVLACAAGGAHAQTSLRTGSLRVPLGKVHYDLSTGRVTKVVRPGLPAGRLERAPGPSGGARERASVKAFRNTLTQGAYTSGVVGVEFVDWAAKGTGRALTTRVVFGYATTVLDPSLGGSGASLDLSFYAGTSDACALGSELERLEFAGLPGATGTLPAGVGAGYLVTAFLAQGIAIPDGRIGWGYSFHDAAPGGPPASATGPLLTDFGTNTGWSDGFGWWTTSPASAGSCAGSFFFGGCTAAAPPPPPAGAPCAGFLLALVEFVPDAQAGCTVVNGSGTNTVHYADLSGGPRIGEVWQSQVDLVTAPAGFASVLAVSAGGFLPAPLSLGGLFGGSELLVHPTLSVPLDFSATGIHSLPIPLDPSLDGLTAAIQAAKLLPGGGAPLQNALDCTFGG